MLNWCYNELHVTGTENDVVNFFQASAMEEEQIEDITYITELSQIPFFMMGTVPRPEEQKENWYDWNTSNWGTKWDMETASIEYYDQHRETVWTIVVSFETAWSPPIEWIVAVSELYPNMVFGITYKEECMGAEGVFAVHNSVILQNERREPVEVNDYSHRIMVNS